MKTEHLLFAHHYILTGDKNEAYKKAYPQACGEALKIAARRLISRPEVNRFIREELTATRQQAAIQYHEQEQRRAEEEYATMLLKRKKLREIISGEAKQKKYFKFKDRIEVVEVEYSPFAIMRAIELDTKIENEWYKKHGKEHVEPAPAPKAEVKETPGYKHISVEDQIELHCGPEYAAGLRAWDVRDNPGRDEEYRQKGLKFLDYVPNPDQFARMKSDHAAHMAELFELRKFLQEREDDYEQLIQEIEQGNDINPDEIPDPPSLPNPSPEKK